MVAMVTFFFLLKLSSIIWHTFHTVVKSYMFTYTLHNVYCILYSVHFLVYTRGRQPMARGPNVALFKKMMALFKF